MNNGDLKMKGGMLNRPKNDLNIQRENRTKQNHSNTQKKLLTPFLHDLSLGRWSCCSNLSLAMGRSRVLGDFETYGDVSF